MLFGQSRKHCNLEAFIMKNNDVELKWSVYMIFTLSNLGSSPQNFLPYGTSDLFQAVVLVPAGSPSRGVDVTVFVSDINQPSLATPFRSVLVSVSVFMTLSIIFLPMNPFDNSPLSHSVLLVLFLPYWSFQLYISL